jgi:leucyl aminopeptidase
MKIQIEKTPIEDVRTEALLLYHFRGEKELLPKTRRMDHRTRGLIRGILRDGDFRGELYQTSLLHTGGLCRAKRILLVGLGKRKDFTIDRWRGAAARGAQTVRDLGVKAFAIPTGELGLDRLSPSMRAQSLVEAIFLGLYHFDELKTENRKKPQRIERVSVLEEEENQEHAIRKGAHAGEVIADGVCLVRDLVSRPGNLNTPSMMARMAAAVADECELTLQVLEAEDLRKEGMGAFLAVAQGSDQPAKFIVLRYHGGENPSATIALVGKGITFDSGGISIKPSNKMGMMKNDMGGAAVVLATMQVAAKLGLPFRLVGILPCAENLPSGKALKPGDVVTTLSGQTIEIISTDAEGRLVLADGLTYALRFKPDAIIDVATLTGACVVALGDRVTGMMGNNARLKARIKKSAELTGEKVWELPLWEEYEEHIKSDIADMKNAAGRAGGAITAATLLSRFVRKTPWVHLDIAGPVWTEKALSYIPKGATGIGVRLLVQFLRDWAGESA